jgi:tRNA-dihydrouridine synthase
MFDPALLHCISHLASLIPQSQLRPRRCRHEAHLLTQAVVQRAWHRQRHQHRLNLEEPSSESPYGAQLIHYEPDETTRWCTRIQESGAAIQ